MNHADLGSIRKSREYMELLNNASKVPMGLRIYGKELIKEFETKIECMVQDQVLSFNVTAEDVQDAMPFLKSSAGNLPQIVLILNMIK